MTRTVRVPASIDAAVAELTGLSELLTATEWHRAAIVATFVRLDLGHGGRGETSSSGPFESARAFADRGIRGLRSTSTVSHYVSCWLDEHDGNYPARDRDVVLPDVPWPPQPRNAGTRMPKSLAVALERLIDEHGVDHVLHLVKRIEGGRLDRSEPQSTPRPSPSIDERWAQWLTHMNGLMVAGVRLCDESEAPDVVLGAYAAAGKALCETLIERRIDAELRDVLRADA